MMWAAPTEPGTLQRVYSDDVKRASVALDIMFGSAVVVAMLIAAAF